MISKLTNKEIKPFMTFGKMPIANGFLNKEDFEKEFFFEMKVGFCEDLSLFQILEHPKPEMMFNEKYPFYTSSSNFMINHFKLYADWIKKNYLKNSKKLIEIGSNDGTFLKNFENLDIETIGFEPSKNVSDAAKNQGINSICQFFNQNNLLNLNKYKNTIDVICAANVICHIPDLKDLFKTVDYCLSKNGVFIFEEPYLGSMFNKVSYDQIYDEHIYIFSATAINNICKLFDLELIDIIAQETHGGSMRYVCGRKKEHNINPIVNKKIEEEDKNELNIIKSCLKFKSDCEKSKKNLRDKINNIKDKNKKICGYAATSKSTTILNYCDIGTDSIDYICDTTKEKIGKYSPGKHIPIKAMDYFYNNIPDVAFLFAWNHKKEIFKKEKKFSENGEWIAHVEL